MATQRSQAFISPEQYFEIERTAEFRSEYISGEMFMMAAPNKPHGQIVINLSGHIWMSLRGKRFEGNAGASVQAPASYLIPDLVIYCDGGNFTKDHNVLIDPVVVFEVLSASPSDYDHGHKWMRYQQIPSLMHYVLISQDEPKVEVFTRDDTEWRYRVIAGIDAIVTLSHLDLTIPLATLYEQVEFPPELSE